MSPKYINKYKIRKTRPQILFDMYASRLVVSYPQMLIFKVPVFIFFLVAHDGNIDIAMAYWQAFLLDFLKFLFVFIHLIYFYNLFLILL
jgi:hypothetical protein